MQNMTDVLWERKGVFFATFFLVFTLSYLLLLAVDFVPEAPTEEETEAGLVDPSGEKVGEQATTVGENTSENESEPDRNGVGAEAVFADRESVSETSSLPQTGTATESDVMERVLPMRISIEKLGRESVVLNPQSRTIANLDAALLEGVVRHPDSAGLGEDGTVFLLGHSSYLPVVINKNFQAFNGIQDLAWGDTIQVYSGAAVYEYQVEKVYRARAQDVTVPIAGDEKRLTLATCNSFGSVDDRYIVEARQVTVRAL